MLPVIKLLVIIVKIPLIEVEKLIPLTQCSLLVEHNFIRSCHNSKKLMQTVAFIFCCWAKAFDFLQCCDVTKDIYSSTVFKYIFEVLVLYFYFYFMLLYTSTSPHLRGKDYTFYSTTFVWRVTLKLQVLHTDYMFTWSNKIHNTLVLKMKND